jgi:menaquinone-dependent protoporphyrinogen oxidase
VAERIRIHGLAVKIRNVREDRPPIDLTGFAGVIVAASVHGGKHEPEMIQFVKRHLQQLHILPSAFISVSLSQAGVERIDATPEEHARFTGDVQKMLNAFFEQTRWRPHIVAPVAGALMYQKYNWFIRWVMKRIAKASGGSTDTTRNHNYTNWKFLDRFADEFMQRVTLDQTAHAHCRTA